jgi:hypothetical protein
VGVFLGDLVSDTFSQEAVPALRPFVAGYMEGENGAIEEAVSELTGDDSETFSMTDILEARPEIKSELCKLSFMKVGVYESSAEKMSEQTLLYHEQSGVSLEAAIVEIMCESITYYIGFIIVFAVIVILLTVLCNISNISFKIPHMALLDNIGGAVAGLAVGFMFCSFAAWVLKFAGALVPESELSGVMANLFVNMDLLSRSLSL